MNNDYAKWVMVDTQECDNNENHRHIVISIWHGMCMKQQKDRQACYVLFYDIRRLEEHTFVEFIQKDFHWVFSNFINFSQYIHKWCSANPFFQINEGYFIDYQIL